MSWEIANCCAKRKFGRIGTNINQIARWLNATSAASHVNDIDAVLVASRLVAVDRALNNLIEATANKRGDPERMPHLTDACEHQWSYRAGVLSFTSDDAPTPEQQRKVMDAFEDLAFAGLEPDQSDILWVRHSHEGRVELHFVTPRMELATGRSLNMAPPGYQKTYDALRDVLNKEHAWSDPQAPERAREVKSLVESVQRGEGRDLRP